MGVYAQLLSNGRYRVLLTGAGAGVSSLESIALTRWSADRTRDAEGFFLYVRDLDRGHLWGAGRQPAEREPDVYRTRSGPGRAEITREDDGITTRLEVCVDPDADAELRLLTLTNRSRKPRNLAVTSYVEVALNHPAADAAHPAFSKLFVQTEYREGAEALLARRRPRSPDEAPVYMGHLMLVEGQDQGDPLAFETDRARFIGRGRTLAHPAALDDGAVLSGSTGNVLDPIFAIQRRVTIPAGASVRLIAILAAGLDRDRVLGLLTRGYVSRAPQIFRSAHDRDQAQLRHAGLPREWRERLPLLMGAAAYGAPLASPDAPLPAASSLVAGDVRALGLAGGLPLLVARVGAPPTAHAVLQLARVATYWRAAGFGVDLLIIDDLVSESLVALPATTGAGRTVVRRSTEIPAELHQLADRAARLTMLGSPPEVRIFVGDIPASRFHPVSEERGDAPLANTEPLLYFNGFGGFTADGTEYVIRMPRERGELRRPPLAWINVIANEELGFLVSESGAGYTWSVNSREHRLTPWSNDPVIDPHGEALYVRDEDSGRFWSPLAGPVPGAGGYEVRHGFGYTRTLHESQQLGQEVVAFVPRHDGVKLVRVRLTNRSARTRRLSVFATAPGARRRARRQRPLRGHRARRRDRRDARREPARGEFAGRVAFAALVAPAARRRPRPVRPRGVPRRGQPQRPAAVVQGRPLDGRAGAGLDPCFAERVVPDARARRDGRVGVPARRGRQPAKRRGSWCGAARARRVTAALDGMRGVLAETVGRFRVRTPAPALDLMVNGWLAYQTLCCRIWGRSAFYQSGGAFGFRDQLQDAAALIYARPELTRAADPAARRAPVRRGRRAALVAPAAEQGHPHALRRRPAVAAVHHRALRRATGDWPCSTSASASSRASRCAGARTRRSSCPRDSGEAADVYEHCCRAIDRSLDDGRARPAADRHRRLERRHEPRRPRGPRRERVDGLLPLRTSWATSLPLCERRGDDERAERYRGCSATWRGASTTAAGTATGTGAPTTTTARRSARAERRVPHRRARAGVGGASPAPRRRARGQAMDAARARAGRPRRTGSSGC